MVLELLNDLFINSSMFYFYFGMIIITIGVSQLLMIHHNARGTQTNFSIRQAQNISLNVASYDKPLVSHELFIIWFVKSFKRIVKLDDDQEPACTSCFHERFKIRGGQQWKKTYSQPYGNIGF